MTEKITMDQLKEDTDRGRVFLEMPVNDRVTLDDLGAEFLRMASRYPGYTLERMGVKDDTHSMGQVWLCSIVKIDQ